MKKLFTYFVVSIISFSSYCQKNNGSVNSIVSADEYVNELFNTNGINKAYSKLIKRNTVFYVPQPVNAKEYYKNNEIVNQVLTKTPDYALLSKSASFGFTSGILTTQIEQNISYERYLTIWKSSKDGKWSIELNAVNPQPKPQTEIKPLFINPENRDSPRIYGPLYIKLREQVIFNTDSIFGDQLKKIGNRAISTFYAENVRLFLPGQFPVIGKEGVIKKIEEKNQAIQSKVTSVNRASSGDIGYTTGSATIGNKSYDYIRVWQKDAALIWNIIIDMYVNEKE
jgi:ketosteroid isomerase-like protein